MKSQSEYLAPRRSVLLVCLVAAAILIFQAIQIWVADYRVHSNRIDQMEHGVALEPENAAAWDRLGRARGTDFVNPDPAGAVADFQKAVVRVPLSAAYWMDLASAYESTGNIPLAREAFNHARALYPASAQVAWSYGNFLLRQGDEASGLAQINHAVQADPSLALPAVSQSWHKNQDANVLLNRVLPATQDAYFQAIDFMAANGQPVGALVIWERLLTLGKRVELRRSFPLLEFLIQSDRAQDAIRVWREALAAAGLPHNERANQSLMWNGDLARDFLNGGLDWRWSSPFGASIGAGFKVALTGQGGDELFGGYTSIQWFERFTHAATWLRPVPRSLARVMLDHDVLPFRWRKLSYLAGADDPFVAAELAVKTLFLEQDIGTLLDPSLIETNSDGARACNDEAMYHLSAWADRVKDCDLREKAAYLNVYAHLGPRLLRDGDAMSMAHSLELRPVFLDHKLVEYVFSLPASLRMQNKKLLLDAMRGLMSAKVYEEIVLRPKRVFSFPFAHWMAGDLRAAIDASFESDRMRATGVLNPAAVRNVWRRCLTHPGRVGWSRVWSLFIMQRWCETMRITR